ncbi:Gfo/Idh/MocA family protein [Lysinibacillus sp. NPDC098008]|uniref:Gfo/Idh/MocA family protein n=1 Tax=Lysinibacillus sp. NPDC098008 TaxID=3364146 RepID=UPI003829B9C4
MSKVKWGILSAANIAYDQLLPAFKKSEYSEVIAIASKTKSKALRFNINTIYEEYEELLNDSNIDAVYIPLPNALHKEWIIKAAEAGKHVLVEKPAVLSAKDMDEIIATIKKTKTIFMEGFMYQFHSQHNEIKRLLNEGVIGKKRHIKAHFSFPLNNPDDIRMNKALGGGAFWDVGCYGMHAVTQLLEFKPKSLTMTSKIEQEVDVTSVCVMKDANDVTAEVCASFELPFENRYEIFGEEGVIVAKYSFRPDESAAASAVINVLDINGHLQSSTIIKDDQYVNQVNYFNDCVLNNKQPHYDALKTKELITFIEDCYKSMQYL